MTKSKLLLNLLFITLLFSSIGLTETQAQYTINNTFGDLAECDTMSRNVFIVWWDNDYDLSDEIDVMLDSMISYRAICLNDLGMQDPPSPEDGYFINVYVHANGFFSDQDWGNGVGTDINGYPYYSAPIGVVDYWNTIAHETFHLFQYNSNSPGFDYSGDSQWYIEASANWFSARQNPGNLRRFVVAESLVRIPNVPLWLSYNNFPAEYPDNWQRYVHQYALGLHLYYLTDVAGVSEDIITSGLYGGVDELPQEYMFNQIGATEFRQHFIDWAAHMTNDFDFISEEQAATNLNEWNTYAELDDDNEFIAIYENEGTDGWYTPEDDKTTHAWSFNTYKLNNSQEGFYTFEINGDSEGSYNDPAHFQGKLVVRNSNSEVLFYDLDMSNTYQGSLELEVSSEDTEIFFIIASMPEIFEDTNASFQKFPYDMRITFDTTTDISSVASSIIRNEIGRFNLLGQKTNKNTAGFQFILYDNGTVEKIYKDNK